MSPLRAGAAALLVAVAAPVLSPLAAQTEQPLLLRAPALSATDICFSSAFGGARLSALGGAS
jgi:hypothetical protein